MKSLIEVLADTRAELPILRKHGHADTANAIEAL